MARHLVYLTRRVIIKLNVIIKMTPDRIYRWSKNIDHIDQLLTKLQVDTEMQVPLFLLRAQLIEYALKSLLIHAPYKFEGFDAEAISRKPLGTIVDKLEECNDPHLEKIIVSARAFVTFRNEVTHHLVDGTRSYKEIADDIAEHLQLAEDIERGIVYFANYVEETLGVNFEEIR